MRQVQRERTSARCRVPAVRPHLPLDAFERLWLFLTLSGLQWSSLRSHALQALASAWIG